MGLPAFSEKRVTLRTNVINLERERHVKRRRLTKSILLELTPQQAEALKELQQLEAERTGKPHKSRAAFLRMLIRNRYKEVTDKEFPDDPQYGGRRE